MSLGSTLFLFVLRIFTDDSDDAFALDNFAFLAHRFYRSSNLHDFLLSVHNCVRTITGSSFCTRQMSRVSLLFTDQNIISRKFSQNKYYFIL